MDRFLFIDFGAIVGLILALAALAPGGQHTHPVDERGVVLTPAGVPIAAMRDDLVGRLEVEPGAVEFVSYQEVTWPDVCTGVTPAGRICAQSLRAGYLVMFRVEGQTYRYHGSASGFVAASFVPASTVSEPLAPGVAVSEVGIRPIEP